MILDCSSHHLCTSPASRETEDYFMKVVEVMPVEYAEVQFALKEEAGDVVRIPVEVIDLFQDFWFELVVRGDVPGGKYPWCWRSRCFWRSWMAR